jgi:AraC-like DNA-binding protein
MSFVRAASLSNFNEVAAQVGLDVGPLLRRVSLDRRAFTDPDLRLPSRQVAELLQLAAEASGCDTFGLRMAESRRLSDLGAVSLLMSHQATMRDALMTVIQYRQLLNEALLVQVDEHPDLVVVREELILDGWAQARQSYDLAVGVMYRIFRAVLGPRWRALSVEFTHGPPADMTVHARVFGPIVRFSSDFCGLTCGRADMDAPNPSADPVLAQFAERYLHSLPGATRASTIQDVQKAIYFLLPSGGASIARIAESLGLNERTLQRRLAAEGAEFSDLLNEIRRGLALRYLANPDLSLSRIADLVGYGRLSSFSRWFAETFGTSASQWRQRQAAETPAA